MQTASGTAVSIACMMVACSITTAHYSMAFRLKVAQKGMILVLVPVIFELLFVAALASLLMSEAQHYQQVQRSKKALLTMQRFYGMAMRAMQVMNTKSEALSNQVKSERLAELLQRMKTTKKGTFGDLSAETHPELMELTEQSESTKSVLMRLLEHAQMAYANSATDLKAVQNTTKQEELLSFILDSQTLNKRFIAIEDRMVKDEPRDLKVFRSELLNVVERGIALSVLVSIMLLIFFTRNLVARLRSITAKAQLIAAGQPLPPPDPRDDEIGKLDRIITTAGKTLTDARLRESAIFDGTAHVMCSLDNKLRIQTIGEACRKQWHYAPDELLGRSLLSLVSPGDVDQARKAFDAITKSAHEGKVETLLRSGDGTLKNMLWNVNWRNRSFYCVVQDVTELRSVEQLRQHFFSMASHDLRSPLTAIGMNLQLISAGAKGPVEESVVREIDKIESNLTQLMSLVNEILALEKLEAAKSTMTLSAVNATVVCQSAKESLLDFARDSQVTLTGPSGNALLIADEEKIEQAVTNLLSSVLKFCRPGSEVSISVEKRDLMGVIKVSQDGYAIPPDEADLIFDKFRQTYIETDRPVKRAGLGFALVKAIAEVHGGTVGVDANAELGSTIWIAIPLHSEDANR